MIELWPEEHRPPFNVGLAWSAYYTAGMSSKEAQAFKAGYFAAASLYPRLAAEVTDAEVEAGAQALFEDPTYDPDYSWSQMVTEDPTRADIWRADARRVLEAARKARL